MHSQQRLATSSLSSMPTLCHMQTFSSVQCPISKTRITQGLALSRRAGVTQIGPFRGLPAARRLPSTDTLSLSKALELRQSIHLDLMAPRVFGVEVALRTRRSADGN